MSEPAAELSTRAVVARSLPETAGERYVWFAGEARAIHEGDAPRRSIIGEATPAEARALAEDDIPVARLPWSSSKSN